MTFVIALACIPFFAYADEEGDTEKCPERTNASHDYIRDSCEKVDNNYHLLKKECQYCHKTKEIKEEHYISNEFWTYKKIDNNFHLKTQECMGCLDTITEKESHSTKYDINASYTAINAHSHKMFCKCDSCNAIVLDGIYAHNWMDYYNCEFKRYNNIYHKVSSKSCLDCGYIIWRNQKHNLEFGKTLKYAALKTPGKEQDYCRNCGQTVVRTVKWTRNGNSSLNYDVKDYTPIYRYSKRVTVKLKRAQPGSVVKLKIGKKTYSKKVHSKKSVKIKIKKPKYGKEVTVWVTYKGKLIGVDDSDNYPHVWYGKKIKRGMTKKQVKYTWGSPDNKGSSSGGWSYWYWNDGSYVAFKRGKVKDWYRAKQ